MITKAIVEDIIDDYRVRVRIPVFDRTEQSSIHTPTRNLDVALLCVQPGCRVRLRVGDVVFVDKDKREENPTILGMLFRPESDEARCRLRLEDIVIDNTATLPADTTIGNITAAQLRCLLGVSSNIQRQLEELKSRVKHLEVAEKTRVQEESTK